MVPSLFYCTNCGAANQPQAAFCFACGQSLQFPSAVSALNSLAGLLQTNEVLRQRYQILNLIGIGGFGAVYKAADLQLGDRIVAVKEMSQSTLKPNEIVEAVNSFKREALMLAGLMHQNLPRIYDHFSEGGRWYVVMDFIEGETLEEYVNNSSGSLLSLDEVLEIGIQLCVVLKYLHTRQPPIIFRDLKPTNVMLTPKGDLFLIDFGIARHFKPGQTKDTIAFGSPGYAAPEQYGKAQTTPRADIYSLGAMLHQLLSGNDPTQTPFRFVPLHIHVPVLERLVMQMVEMDESKRPSSMADVVQELQNIVDGLDAGQTSVGPANSSVQSSTTRTHLAIIAPSADATLLIFRNDGGNLKSVAWSPDSKSIASADAEKVQVWDADSGIIVITYHGHTDRIKGLVWSPDGTRVASASKDGMVKIWHVDTGDTLITYKGHSGWGKQEGNLVAWSPDGMYMASVGTNKSVHVWDPTTGEKIFTYRGHAGLRHQVNVIAWSHDSKRIATACNDGTVYIWNLATQNIDFVYRDHTNGVTSIGWSTKDTYISSAGFERAVRVWDSITGASICRYHGHSHFISAVAWSPDGTYIASGGFDETTQVWNAKTGKTIFTYRGHSAWVLAVAWSPDGKRIASGSADGTIQVWRAPLKP